MPGLMGPQSSLSSVKRSRLSRLFSAKSALKLARKLYVGPRQQSARRAAATRRGHRRDNRLRSNAHAWISSDWSPT